jgi:uncharacterized protein
VKLVLSWIDRAATRRPLAVLLLLVVVTVALGTRAATLEVEVDLTEFGLEGSRAMQAMDRVRDEFDDPNASTQVILDAGPTGDMLSVRGLEAIQHAETIATETLGPDLRTDEQGQPLLLSPIAGPGERPSEGAPDATSTDGRQVGDDVARAVAAQPHLATLVSDDLDLEDGTARAVALVALLEPALSEDERAEVGEALRTAFEEDRSDALDGVDVTVFSSGLFVAGLIDAVRTEAPLLVGLTLLVVLAVLAAAFRSTFDVLVGAGGLLASVAWTAGFMALLGPGHLGWTGPPSQLAVIVPVLVIGLGIDYSVHLTARYREQRAVGQDPAAAAGHSLRTVGTALLVATAATATGFAANGTAPLRMVADFGIFVSVGVVCAFTVMALLVPSTQVLRDRRRPDRREEVSRSTSLDAVTRVPVAAALRVPAAGAVIATLLVTVSLVAAAGLETEFDRDDFVPEGSEVQRVLAHQRELFGAGLTESTFVLVDGDLTDPRVFEAMRAAHDDLADVDGVHTVDDQAQARSAVSMVAAIVDGGASGTGREVDLEAVYEELRRTVGAEQVDRVLARDARAGLVQIRTVAGDAGAARLRRDVHAAFSPVEREGATVTVTSEPIIIAELSRELSRFQARAIGWTLAIVTILMTAYYAAAHRRWLLGPIVMIPAIVSASLVVGTMRIFGISFNAVTATLTAIAVGIGVPYGVHLVNRFVEDVGGSDTAGAMTSTLRHTGGALTGSALTTFGAFVVLSFSDLPPIRSLGVLGGVAILFALLAALLVQPGAMVLWANRRDPGEGDGSR